MSNPKSRLRTTNPVQKRRTSNLLVPIIALVTIVLVGLGVALLAGGDDGGSDGGTLATAGVTVRGDALAPYAEGADPGAGTPAPTLEGVSPAGTPVDVEYGEPTLLAFLAHWCPHCQAELPRLVTMLDNGALDGLDPVVVLTGTDSSAPNYPPGAWVEEEGWEGRVILDDEEGTAAGAFGLTSYPFLVLVDADGNVIDRSAGEMGLERLIAFVEQAR